MPFTFLCGDIHCNAGPVRYRNKFSCGICALVSIPIIDHYVICVISGYIFVVEELHQQCTSTINLF